MPVIEIKGLDLGALPEGASVTFEFKHHPMKPTPAIDVLVDGTWTARVEVGITADGLIGVGVIHVNQIPQYRHPPCIIAMHPDNGDTELRGYPLQCDTRGALLPEY